MPTITFTCTRQSSSKCLRSFEVDEDDLRGPVDEQAKPIGDPSLLPIVVPPDGWLDDPGLDADEQFVCVECPTSNWSRKSARGTRGRCFCWHRQPTSARAVSQTA